MYVTKTKIYYGKEERLIILPKNTETKEGYRILKTQDANHKFAINTTPLYILRDEEIETGKLKNEIQKEYFVRECDVKSITATKKSLETKLLYSKLLKLYESVHLFKKGTHYIEDSSYENFYTDSNGNTVFISPNGYGFDYTKEKPIYILESPSFSYIVACLQNTKPILATKPNGTSNYEKKGIPLATEDTILLKKKHLSRIDLQHRV